MADADQSDERPDVVERPAIPHDPLPDTDHQNSKRSTRKLAEAGKRRGRPVNRIPHEGKIR